MEGGGWIGRRWAAETVPATEVRDGDDPDWGGHRSRGDREPRSREWLDLELSRMCHEGGGGDKKDCRLPVWGQVGWLQ